MQFQGFVPLGQEEGCRKAAVSQHRCWAPRADAPSPARFSGTMGLVKQIGKNSREGFSKALSMTEEDESCLIKNNYNTSVGKHASAKS